MSPERIAILILAFIGLALLLAIVIHRINQWWKQHPPIEQPTSPPTLREMNVLPPHRSAARPSNVMAIARKRIRKSPPKAA